MRQRKVRFHPERTFYIYATGGDQGTNMGDKIATVEFWLVAGSLTTLLLVVPVGTPLRSLELWQIITGLVGAVALIFGLRLCDQILRGRWRSSS